MGDTSTVGMRAQRGEREKMLVCVCFCVCVWKAQSRQRGRASRLVGFSPRE